MPALTAPSRRPQLRRGKSISRSVSTSGFCCSSLLPRGNRSAARRGPPFYCCGLGGPSAFIPVVFSCRLRLLEARQLLLLVPNPCRDARLAPAGPWNIRQVFRSRGLRKRGRAGGRIGVVWGCLENGPGCLLARRGAHRDLFRWPLFGGEQRPHRRYSPPVLPSSGTPPREDH